MPHCSCCALQVRTSISGAGERISAVGGTATSAVGGTVASAPGGAAAAAEAAADAAAAAFPPVADAAEEAVVGPCAAACDTAAENSTISSTFRKAAIVSQVMVIRLKGGQFGAQCSSEFCSKQDLKDAVLCARSGFTGGKLGTHIGENARREVTLPIVKLAVQKACQAVGGSQRRISGGLHVADGSMTTAYDYMIGSFV